MQTVVGILRGGPSREHEISLATGAAMLAALPPERFAARDIYIDRAGVWHDRGRPTIPERVLRQLDAALISIPGAYGEGGELQRLLARFGVPYAGAEAYGTHLAFHRVLSRAQASDAGLAVPPFRFIENEGEAEARTSEAVRAFRQPMLVVPVGWGSTHDALEVGGYAPALSAVTTLFRAGAPAVLIEESVRGTKLSVGVIEGMRGETLYALPATAPDSDLMPRLSRVNAEEVAGAARLMHRALGLRHYSESSFMVSPRGITYLTTAAIPEFTPDSSFVRALAAVGIPRAEFLVHVLTLTGNAR